MAPQATPSPSPYVRLKDIAERAGVSVMTVSLALRNDTRISSRRRSEVCKLAEEMGYKPNAMLSALADYRSSIKKRGFLETMAMVVAHDEDTTEDPWFHFEAEAAPAREHAEELGYALDLIYAGQTRKQQAQAGRILRNRGIRGVIVNPAYCHISDIALPWDSLAAVFLWSIPKNDAPLVSVGCNNFLSSLRLVQKLVGRGYVRPGLIITAQPAEASTVQWVGGFEAGVITAKLPHPVPPLVLGDYQPGLISKWLKKHKPDVVIGTSGDWLLGELAKLGFQVPRDIGYCGLDVGPEFSTVSGMRQNRADACRVAVDLLSSMLRRNATGPAKSNYFVTIDAQWKDGLTLRRRGPRR